MARKHQKRFPGQTNHPREISKPNSPDSVIEQPANVQKRSVQIQQEISMPAQLQPHLISKFEREDIKAIVQSFVRSVDYQNETDRKAMESHYKSVNRTQTKRFVYAAVVTSLSFVGLYFSSSLDKSWVLLLIALGMIEAPYLFEGISTLLKKLLPSSEKEANKKNKN